MKDHIDLVIPRGSQEMIADIKRQSKDIPVLGHADGICHVYIDKEADLDMAVKIGETSCSNYSFSLAIFFATGLYQPALILLSF